MSRRIRRHRLVATDVREIARYIARDSLGSALRFYDRVDSTLNGLVEMPGKVPVREFDHPKLMDVRSCPVDGFPNHLIFFRRTSKGIEVIAILHGARDLEPALINRVASP